MKSYIGDGVYAEFTHHGDLVLTTEDGVQVLNRIHFSKYIWRDLLLFIKRQTGEGECPNAHKFGVQDGE